MILKRFLTHALVRSTGIYTLASFLNAAIPFLLMPYLTRILNPADYGMIAMFTLFMGFASPIVSLSISSAISTRYFENGVGRYALASYIGSSVFLLLINTTIVLVVALLFNSILTEYTALNSSYLMLAILVVFFQTITTVQLAILQVKNQVVSYGMIQIFQTVLNVLITICLVGNFGFKWEGRVYAQSLSVLIVASLSMWMLIRNKSIIFKINKKYVKHVFFFGAPLIFHSIGGYLIGMVDRIFIAKMVNMKEAGLYTLAFQLGSVLNLLMMAVNTALIPWLYKNMKEGKYEMKIKMVKLTYIFFTALIGAVFTGSFIAPYFMAFFVGKIFLGATYYIFWVLLGFAFNGMYLLIAPYVCYVGKTSFLAYATFTAGLINIPLCYYLIQKNGAIGAPQSTAIANLIGFLFTWFLANKVYKMPWLEVFKTKNHTI